MRQCEGRRGLATGTVFTRGAADRSILINAHGGSGRSLRFAVTARAQHRTNKSPSTPGTCMLTHQVTHRKLDKQQINLFLFVL